MTSAPLLSNGSLHRTQRFVKLWRVTQTKNVLILGVYVILGDKIVGKRFCLRYHKHLW